MYVDPLFRQGAEHKLRDSGMAAHPDPDDRHLSNVGVRDQAVEGNIFLAASTMSLARSKSASFTVKVTSVDRPSSDTL